MVVTRHYAVDRAARLLLDAPPSDRHKRAAEITGVPSILIGTLDLRESDCNPHAALGQGDPWNQVSTHVPRGKGPFRSWVDAAVYYIRYDALDNHTAPWSWAYLCWKGEIWNGFGPRNHGRHTGYLWSGTNVYDPPAGKGGKYVADGVWDPGEVDEQVGIIPVMRRMVELDSSLDDMFNLPPAVSESPPATPEPSPGPVGGGLTGTKWIQNSLNKIMNIKPPLVVDGSYGKLSRNAVRLYQESRGLLADGLVGDETMTQMDKDLAKL